MPANWRGDYITVGHTKINQEHVSWLLNKYFRLFLQRSNNMRKEGLEPSRLAARDPKSRLSASSSTSPI